MRLIWIPLLISLMDMTASIAESVPSQQLVGHRKSAFQSLSLRPKPFDNSETHPTRQNPFITLETQPLSIDRNGLVGLPPAQSINENIYDDLEAESRPVNQNKYVKPLQFQSSDKKEYVNPQIDDPPTDQFAGAPDRFLLPQSEVLPTNQNGIVKLLEFPGIREQRASESLSMEELAERISQAPKINQPGSGLSVAFRWRFLDWVDPTVSLTGKNFTLGNPLTQDVDIDRRGRVFVTSPQWLEGVPITLSVLTNVKGAGGPLLTPYPDWTWHKPSCDSLVSVYRVAIDECDRLWMVDTGTASGKPVCPMKLVVFNLRTDELVLKYVIPDDQTVDGGASYVSPVVDVGDSCQDAHLYVADVLKHGLLIFSLRERRSWRLDNTPGNAFGSDPEGRNLTIAGESFDLNDGTLGMSLSPRGFFAKRYLYFNSLASFYQKFTDTNSLKTSDTRAPIVHRSLAKRASQAGVQATSRTGAIFFQLAQFTALACWNIGRAFAPENIVVLAQDDVALQYVSGMKVVRNAHGSEELWLNTNRLQRTIKGTRRIEEVNFRLIRGRVDEMIRGTLCEPTGYPQEKPDPRSWERI